MTQIEVSSAERKQRVWARIAGFLFLWLIVTGLAGMPIISHIEGSGTFAEVAKRIEASEHLYRLARCIGLLEPLSTVLLAFALYVTLKPVDQLLALFAMVWRLGESFIGSTGSVLGFAKLHLYTSASSVGALGTAQSQALVDLAGRAGFAFYNISAIFFSIGSTLFFYLFFKSRYIPRILSAFGVFASLIVTIMCFGTLIFPEHAGTIQYGWAPMALAEVSTAFWLMIFAVKIPAQTIQPSAPQAVIGS